jgi:hypothetical protein
MREKRTIEGQWRIFGNRRRSFLGWNEHRRAITLLGCARVGGNQTVGFESHNIKAMAGVLGGHFGSWREVLCSTVDVHYSILDNWLLRPISEPIKLPDGKCALTLSRYPDAVFQIDDKVSLAIVQCGSIHNGIQELRIGQHHIFRFFFREPVLLEDARSQYIHPLRNLLTLLTNTKAFIDSIIFAKKGQNTIRAPLELLANNSGVGKADRKTISPFMLVPYEHVEAKFPQIIKKWFSYYRDMEAVLSLYFTAVWFDGIPSTTHFLLLAQALEAYHNRSQQFTSSIQSTPDFHRRLAVILDGMANQAERPWLKEKLQHANQKHLAQRLSELISRNKTEVARFIRDPEDFASKIRHTRNYYTHFDEDLKRRGKVAEGKDLVLLTIWARAILQISFFRDLGLPQAAIDGVVSRARSVDLISLDT